MGAWDTTMTHWTLNCVAVTWTHDNANELLTMAINGIATKTVFTEEDDNM